MVNVGSGSPSKHFSLIGVSFCSPHLLSVVGLLPMVLCWLHQNTAAVTPCDVTYQHFCGAQVFKNRNREQLSSHLLTYIVCDSGISCGGSKRSKINTTDLIKHLKSKH